jgi:hypothetical protein
LDGPEPLFDSQQSESGIVVLAKNECETYRRQVDPRRIEKHLRVLVEEVEQKLVAPFVLLLDLVVLEISPVEVIN